MKSYVEGGGSDTEKLNKWKDKSEACAVCSTSTIWQESDNFACSYDVVNGVHADVTWGKNELLEQSSIFLYPPHAWVVVVVVVPEWTILVYEISKKPSI